MLRFLRKKGNIKKIMWGLAILIVPAFVLWGSGSAIRSRGMPKYAGKIFGKKISFRQYEQNFRACRNQALLIYGDQLHRIAKYLDLENQAWERLILLYQAEKEKIKVTDKEVIELIDKMPLFQKQDRFDRERYNMLLDYAFRTSPRDFEEQIREALKIDKLKNKVTENVELTDAEIEQAYKEENEKAKVFYVFIDPQGFFDQIHPSFEQLQEYYSNHKNEFKKPEQVNVKYIALNLDEDAAEVEVNEEEINSYYQDHLDEFTVEKDKKEITKPLEEVKAQIKEKLIHNKVKAALEEKMWQIADTIGLDGATFEDVAEKNQLQIKETGFFGPQQAIPEIGLSYKFLNTAFALKINEVSDVTETQKGFFIIKAKERKQSYIPVLEDIKTEVENELIKEKSKQLAKEKGEQILSQIKKLIEEEKLNFRKAAEKLSLTVKETDEFSRSSYVPGIGQSQQFTKAAFALKPEGVSNLVTLVNGYCILSLKEIIPIDTEKFAQEKEEFAKKVLARKEDARYRIWLTVLKQKADLEDNIKKIAPQ